jgi:NADH dehydrogenase
MRVALIGGTGFIGSYLVDALIAHGHEPSLLVRAGSEGKVRQVAECRLVTGDVSEEMRIDELLSPADAVIYNVGILREVPADGSTFDEMHYRGATRSMNAALRCGVSRFLLMSANGAAPSGTAYHQSKYRAEEALVASGLEYTIFRPSVVFGDPRGREEIATRLCRQLIRPPLPAVWFHTGLLPSAESVRLSPVHVADVADAFVAALDEPATRGRTLKLGGPEALSWKTLLARVARAVGKRKLMLPMPIPVMLGVAAIFDRWPWFPVTQDQLAMLAAGNVVPGNALRQLIGRELNAFAAPSLDYLPASCGST